MRAENETTPASAYLCTAEQYSHLEKRNKKKRILQSKILNFRITLFVLKVWYEYKSLFVLCVLYHSDLVAAATKNYSRNNYNPYNLVIKKSA